jgi:hypothetical protein
VFRDHLLDLDQALVAPALEFCGGVPGGLASRAFDQALATPARIRSSARGAGSVATTSRPFARQRAAQPVPMTPVPTIATLSMRSAPASPGSLFSTVS